VSDNLQENQDSESLQAIENSQVENLGNSEIKNSSGEVLHSGYRLKTRAVFVGILSMVLAIPVGVVAGVFGSIPFEQVNEQYFGREFFGTLIGVVVAIICFAVFINLLGHMFGVRKDAVALFTSPPARFNKARGARASADKANGARGNSDRAGGTRGRGANLTLLISTMGMVTAFGVVLNVFSLSLPGFGGRASFVYAFMYLSGILFGPIYGFAVAFLGDFIGHLLAPEGLYSPFIGVGNGLTATIVALLFMLRLPNKVYKDALLLLFAFICIATIASAYYFGAFYEGGNEIVNQDTGEVTLSTGRGLHNGARVVIIATAASLLIYGVYKIISMPTHNENGQEKEQWFVKLLMGAIIAFVPATLILGSYGIYVLGIMPGNFQVIVLARLISQPVWVGLNLFLMYLIIPPLNRTVFKDQPIV